MLRYRRPSQVNLIQENRPLLTTPQGGKVAVDAALAALWKDADGRCLEEIVARFRSPETPEEVVLAGLACLSEAGLLDRGVQRPPGRLQMTPVPWSRS